MCSKKKFLNAALETFMAALINLAEIFQLKYESFSLRVRR